MFCRSIPLLGLAFIIWGLTACNLKKAGDNRIQETMHAKAELGKAAPDFALRDQEGRTIKLSDFTGRIVVLEWINLECPFSQRHYGEGTFRNLAIQYASSGVSWLAINSTHWAKASSNKEWHDQYELPYPILDDSEGKVGKMYGAKTTPHMFIIDKAGRLVYSGGIDDDPSGTLGEKRVQYVRLALEDLTAGREPQTKQTKPYG